MKEYIIFVIAIMLLNVSTKFQKEMLEDPNGYNMLKDGDFCPKGSTVVKGSDEKMYRLTKKVPGKIRIACVGDSITCGQGGISDKNLEEDGIN